MKFSIVKHSRIGARKMNQDRVGYSATDLALLVTLADGMGGHLRGELAAQIAVDHFEECFAREAKPKLPDPVLFLHQTCARAHAAIRRTSREMGLRDAPRTVFVCGVVQDGHLYWTHLGDSRLYLIRRGIIVVRSKDHSHVQQLVDEGRIRAEAAEHHPQRHIVLRCLGSDEPPQPEPVQSARLLRNDIVLLCSDGFWSPLTQRLLISSLVTKNIEQAIPELMTLAEQRADKHSDNLSAVAMMWDEDAVEERASSET